MDFPGFRRHLGSTPVTPSDDRLGVSLRSAATAGSSAEGNGHAGAAVHVDLHLLAGGRPSGLLHGVAVQVLAALISGLLLAVVTAASTGHLDLLPSLPGSAGKTPALTAPPASDPNYEITAVTSAGVSGRCTFTVDATVGSYPGKGYLLELATTDGQAWARQGPRSTVVDGGRALRFGPVSLESNAEQTIQIAVLAIPTGDPEEATDDLQGSRWVKWVGPRKVTVSGPGSACNVSLG